MRLKDWRELKKLTQAHIAEMIGSTEAAVSRHEVGLRLPTVPNQNRYFEISQGAITPADWVELWSDPEAVRLRAEETATRHAREQKKRADAA